MKNSTIYTRGEAYDRIFRALGDPHRIQIIELLKEKELSAGEILEAIDVVQSTLSHHMKTLSDSGAVNAVRRGKWTYYSLNESNLANASQYLAWCAEGTKVRKAEAAPKDGAVVKKPSARTDVKKAPAPAVKTEEKAAEKATEKAAVKTAEKAGKKKEKEKKNKKSKKSKK